MDANTYWRDNKCFFRSRRPNESPALKIAISAYSRGNFEGERLY